MQDVAPASRRLHVFALELHVVAGRELLPRSSTGKVVHDVDAAVPVQGKIRIGAAALVRRGGRRNECPVEFLELSPVGMCAPARHRVDASDTRDFGVRALAGRPTAGGFESEGKGERPRQRCEGEWQEPAASRDHVRILLARWTGGARRASFAEGAGPLSFGKTIPMFDLKSLTEEELLERARWALKSKRYEIGRDLFAEYCSRMAEKNIPVPPGVVASYALARGHAREMKTALEMCRKALAADRSNAYIHACLAELYMHSGARRQAVETIRRGLAASPDYPVLLRLRDELGVRQRPPIAFLPRANPVNVALGRRIRKLRRPAGQRPA